MAAGKVADLDRRLGQIDTTIEEAAKRGFASNTPTELIAKLNKEINAALADAEFRARIADFGSTPLPMTPAAFGKFIAEETEKRGKVMRSANIKAQ